MKALRKILAVICVITILASFSSCSLVDGLIEQQTATVVSAIDGLEAKELVVGLLFSHDLEHGDDIPAVITGQNAGINKASEFYSFGSLVVQQKLAADDVDEVENSISSLITSSGCNVIVGTEAGYADVMEKLSKEYPKVLFACYDEKPTLADTANFFTYSIDTDKAFFDAGAESALLTSGSEIIYDKAVYGESDSDKALFVEGVKSKNASVKVVDGTFAEDAKYVSVTENWDVFFISLFDVIINDSAKAAMALEANSETGACNVNVPGELSK